MSFLTLQCILAPSAYCFVCVCVCVCVCVLACKMPAHLGILYEAAASVASMVATPMIHVHYQCYYNIISFAIQNRILASFVTRELYILLLEESLVGKFLTVCRY